MLRALPKYISSHAAVIVRDNIPHSDNRPEIKAGKLLSGCFIDVSCRFSENFKCKRSTNPIWRLAPAFGQLDSWNEKTNLVVVDGAAGRKSDDWSMNLKRADWKGRSSAEAGLWRSVRCSDICV